MTSVLQTEYHITLRMHSSVCCLILMILTLARPRPSTRMFSGFVAEHGRSFGRIRRSRPRISDVLREGEEVDAASDVTRVVGVPLIEALISPFLYRVHNSFGHSKIHTPIGISFTYNLHSGVMVQ
jgi:hypothetical protein